VRGTLKLWNPGLMFFISLDGNFPDVGGYELGCEISEQKNGGRENFVAGFE
jgi:hypothetical protein